MLNVLFDPLINYGINIPMKKTASRKLSNIVFISSAAAIFLADQLSKYWINSMAHDIFPISVMPNIFYIKRITNSGIAFGLFQNRINIIIAISIIAVTLIIILKIKLRLCSYVFNLGIGMLLGGAIGNLADRIIFGEVTDFLSIHSFAVLNIADASINIGIAITAVMLVRDHMKKYRKETGNSS